MIGFLLEITKHIFCLMGLHWYRDIQDGMFRGPFFDRRHSSVCTSRFCRKFYDKEALTPALKAKFQRSQAKRSPPKPESGRLSLKDS